MSRTKRRKSAYCSNETPAHYHWYYSFLLTVYADKPEIIEQRWDKHVEENKKLIREFRTDNGWRTGLYGKPIKEETRLKGARSHIRRECERVVREADYDEFDPDKYNTVIKYSRWVGW
jgi:hypothetical protein